MDGTVVDVRKRIHAELTHFVHVFLVASFLHHRKTPDTKLFKITGDHSMPSYLCPFFILLLVSC